MRVTPSVLRSRCASQRHGPERGSVSRSIVTRKERVELVGKLEFQATLQRVTDPRSDSTPALPIAVP